MVGKNIIFNVSFLFLWSYSVSCDLQSPPVPSQSSSTQPTQINISRFKLSINKLAIMYLSCIWYIIIWYWYVSGLKLFGSVAFSLKDRKKRWSNSACTNYVWSLPNLILKIVNQKKIYKRLSFKHDPINVSNIQYKNYWKFGYNYSQYTK